MSSPRGRDPAFWREIEQGLLTGELCEEQRHRLAEIIQVINLAVDDPELSATEAANLACEVLGFTPAAIRGFREGRRASYGHGWLQFLAAHGLPLFGKGGRSGKVETAAHFIGSAIRPRLSARQVFRTKRK